MKKRGPDSIRWNLAFGIFIFNNKMMMDFDQRVILLSKLKLKKNECKPNNNTFVWFNVLSLWKWLKVVLGVDKIVTNSILFCTNNHIYIYIVSWLYWACNIFWIIWSNHIFNFNSKLNWRSWSHVTLMC